MKKDLKLFGVRIVGERRAGKLELEFEEEVMRKSFNMGNLASAAPAGDHIGGEQDYLSDGRLQPSLRSRTRRERGEAGARAEREGWKRCTDEKKGGGGALVRGRRGKEGVCAGEGRGSLGFFFFNMWMPKVISWVRIEILSCYERWSKNK